MGPLTSLAEELRKRHGIECVTAAVDLSDDDATQKMVQAVGNREVGLFISNAGADSIGSLFLEGELAAWNSLVMRNVMTVMRSCHHFAQPMRARRRGGIVIVNSGACYGGIPALPYIRRRRLSICVSARRCGQSSGLTASMC